MQGKREARKAGRGERHHWGWVATAGAPEGRVARPVLVSNNVCVCVCVCVCGCVWVCGWVCVCWAGETRPWHPPRCTPRSLPPRSTDLVDERVQVDGLRDVERSVRPIKPGVDDDTADGQLGDLNERLPRVILR